MVISPSAPSLLPLWTGERSHFSLLLGSSRTPARKSSFKMIFMRLYHIYVGGHFVVVVLVKQQKIHIKSTVNVEIMSNMFENINKSNFVAKYL